MPESRAHRRVTPLWVQGTRVFLGMIFFTAGAGKLIPGFPGVIGPTWLVDRLEPHGLGLFAEFIALSQVAIGALLMSGRFATLGAIMLVPMLTCILMVTVSLGWRGTPYVNAVLLLLNLALLAYDAPKWRSVVADDAGASGAPAAVGLRAGDAAWLVALAVLLGSPVLFPDGREGVLYLIPLSGLIVLGLRLVEQRRLPAAAREG